ncbi:MAG: L-histidine N(alpha)-methyltransferase [Planctomycetota bacterium]
MTDDRLSLIVDAPVEAADDFGTDVARSLSRNPKRIDCRWLYDARGSEIFDAICELDDYYPTRAEAEILGARSDDIVDLVHDDAVFVELGSGSSIKTRRLLDAFFRERDTLEYVPIDISRAALESSARDLLDDYDDLEVTGIVGEYERGFEWMEERKDREKLIVWLGSTIGNFDREAAKAFLSRLRRHMTDRDRLLIGVDLRKDRDVLERAYDDSEGVTADFTLNVLERMNRELGGHFDVDGFEHNAVYQEDEGRVVLSLESKRDQTVRVDDVDLDLTFAEGERIHVEDSYKYSFEEIDDLARSSGFEVAERWLDGESRFSVNLFRPSATA